MVRIKDIIKMIEFHAPSYLQEDYDNSGIIIGNIENDVSSVLICLDINEKVIDYAIEKRIDLIISHHPVIFRPLKKINGYSLTETLVLKAIRNDINIYSAHTNIDNSAILREKIAQILEIKKYKPLVPYESLYSKLVWFTPSSETARVKSAVFAAGAGHIGNYDSCSYNVDGYGTFRALEGACPFVGEIGQVHQENEVRTEVIFPKFLKNQIIEALDESHPYEEVAYDIYSIDNKLNEFGYGLIGNLDVEINLYEYLLKIKNTLCIQIIRHNAENIHKKIKTIAYCGGSGASFINNAINQKADLIITSDIKYHEFFDFKEMIAIADIGHYESEKMIIDIFFDILKNNNTFAVQKIDFETNPIKLI